MDVYGDPKLIQIQIRFWNLFPKKYVLFETRKEKNFIKNFSK